MNNPHELLNKLVNPDLSHDDRISIGERLAHSTQIGDPRFTTSADGIPDIRWCMVNVPDHPVTCRNERGIVYGEFTLSPFAIATYPVTVAQFAAFIHAPDGFNNDAWWHGLTPQYRQQPILAQRTDINNHPRDSVSWYQAVAFARWLHAHTSDLPIPGGQIRLPLEWEWQYAAQGESNQPYPWGVWDARRANTREARTGRTTAVGMYPHGASWCGALDMSGNVWEWCLNAYSDPTHTDVSGHVTRVLRGGSFVDVADWAVCGSRFNDLPNRRLDYFGFRVVCGASIESV
jgi:formylglycine-generating enzyme required for sulfatase activity